MRKKARLNVASLLESIRGRSGKEYWRGLEELADTEEFREYLHQEFPRQASVWSDGFSRRDFLQLMAASLALGGLSGCMKSPQEKIIPYVKQPEEIVPGKPLYYSSAWALGGYAAGIVVTSNMGRPTKIEGNPGHPASLGATDAITQASLLTLYDPDRSQNVIHDGVISTWTDFVGAISVRGPRVAILTGTVTSPTLGSQIGGLLKSSSQIHWHQYEPVNLDAVWEGSRIAFGEYVQTRYDFSKADVVLSLESDFLISGPGNVRYARDFSDRRRVKAGSGRMNRLYVIESAPTQTGAVADHHLRVPSSQVEAFARTIASRLGVPGMTVVPPPRGSRDDAWLSAVVHDLQGHRGSSVVLAGPHQPAEVHALAHAMNAALGNAGTTVIYTEPVEVRPERQDESLRALVNDMRLGNLDVLVVVGSNPVYTAPPDLGFADAMRNVPMRIHLGLYRDETAELCQWHIPEAHYLEAWSDARAFDGTASIVQPLIAPLYDGKTSHELLEEIAGRTGAKGYDVVRNTWKSRVADFDQQWSRWLNDGVIPRTEAPVKRVALNTAAAVRPSRGVPAPSGEALEVTFRPDPTIWDGRFANNGWLQELAKPFTKVTWDNVAMVSPSVALAYGLADQDVVELHYRARVVEAPVKIQPGHPDSSVTIFLGYGRIRAGNTGNGAGYNAYLLRDSSTPWFGPGLSIKKTGRQYPLAGTQEHFLMEGRDQVRSATLAKYLQDPQFAREENPPPAKNQTLYPQPEYTGHAWGMSIDLAACIGCNACVLACQSENNIPIVGKKQVENSREMHWIRIDTYYRGDLEDPETLFQPVPCMHCEYAPCELVCPVGATVHDSEGLNLMVYNRCIGTRYCSNNCPYKVRRFNFLQYEDNVPSTIKMMHNPDVTVRSRGVMEKCTYCIQRINEARITAEEQDRPLRDGDIVTACQAACPTQAIVFGDINDKESKVAGLKAEPRDYGLLAELNTRPRTTYLARITNPNPGVEKAS